MALEFHVSYNWNNLLDKSFKYWSSNYYNERVVQYHDIINEKRDFRDAFPIIEWFEDFRHLLKCFVFISFKTAKKIDVTPFNDEEYDAIEIEIVKTNMKNNSVVIDKVSKALSLFREYGMLIIQNKKHKDYKYYDKFARDSGNAFFLIEKRPICPHCKHELVAPIFNKGENKGESGGGERVINWRDAISSGSGSNVQNSNNDNGNSNNESTPPNYIFNKQQLTSQSDSNTFTFNSNQFCAENKIAPKEIVISLKANPLLNRFKYVNPFNQ